MRKRSKLGRNQIIDFSKNEGEKFIIKYSQMEDTHRKEQDFAIMRNIHHLNIQLNHLFPLFHHQQKKRRSTNLSSLISPSIVASMYDQMSKIDKCDFNIFEVDKIWGKKTVIYIASEILGKFPFVENGDIPSDIFKNFITQIVTLW